MINTPKKNILVQMFFHNPAWYKTLASHFFIHIYHNSERYTLYCYSIFNSHIAQQSCSYETEMLTMWELDSNSNLKISIFARQVFAISPSFIWNNWNARILIPTNIRTLLKHTFIHNGTSLYSFCSLRFTKAFDNFTIIS